MNAHLIVVHLRKFVQVQGRDEGLLLAEVALPVQVLAVTETDRAELPDPYAVFRRQVVLAPHDSHIQLQPIPVFKEFSNPVVHLKKRTDQNQPLLRVLDQLLKVKREPSGSEKSGHRSIINSGATIRRTF